MTYLPRRIMANIKKSSNGCWHWTGYIDANGYGHISVGSRINGTRRDVPAHRFAYEQVVQALPARRGEPGHLQVDHECHNRSKSCKGGPTCLHRRCVNPQHLRATSAKANVLAGKTPAARNKAKTHCPQGHEYIKGNTYIGKTGGRACKQCQLDNSLTNHRQRAALKGRQPHWQTLKTECPRGHPYTGDNLFIRNDGARSCRKCQRERSAKWKKRKLAGLTMSPARERTHCPQGHLYSGDNLYIPPKGGTRGCRTCRNDNSQRRLEAERAERIAQTGH